MGNLAKKDRKKQSFHKVSRQIAARMGAWYCDDDGIFFDKKQYSKMFYMVKKEPDILFKEFFVLLRLRSVHYQVRRNIREGVLYLTLYAEVESFAAARQYFEEIIESLDRMSRGVLEFIPMGTSEHLRMANDFNTQHMHCTTCHFELNEQFNRIYMIGKTSETMSDCLENARGISYLATEIAGISDSLVVEKMKALYLDAEQIVSRLMKKDPELYDLYINGSQCDSMSYTIAGSLVLLSDDIEENLNEYGHELEQMAADNGFEILPAFGEQQRELLGILYPIRIDNLPTRMNRTEMALEFCKRI